jgi:hypothetical protein
MLRRRFLCALSGLVLAAGGLHAQGSILSVQGSTAPGQRAGQGKAPLITMSSVNGFRWAQSETISIGEANGKPSITIERKPYEERHRKQGPTTREITAAQRNAVLKALRDNRALELPTDRSKASVTDVPTYTFTLSLDGKSHTFVVIGPEIMMTDNPRYHAVWNAVSELAEQILPTPPMD